MPSIEDRLTRIEHDMAVLIRSMGRMRELMAAHQRMFEQLTAEPPDAESIRKAQRAMLN